MRAIVFGQSGVDHNCVKESLCDYAYKKRTVHWFDFEEELIQSVPGYGMMTLLISGDSEVSLKKFWGEAFLKLLAKIKKLGEADVVISMHASFFRANRFILPIQTELIRRFHPDICVTLIDDIQDVWARLKMRYLDDTTNGYFRLDEIANWRTVEIAVGDMIAEAAITERSRVKNRLGMIKNHVLAVKHPVENLFRLLFERDQYLLVYACCGITRPREEADLRREVDEYRSRLHRDYIVYDPLTIDEGPIRTAFRETFRDVDIKNPDPQLPLREDGTVPTVIIGPEARWPLTPVKRLVPGLSELEKRELSVVGIPANEVVRLCYQRDDDSGDVIFDHIKQRDFRLIDQSDVVPAWRPVLRGSVSGGQNAELNYADSTNKPSMIYWPNEDGMLNTPFRWRGARRRYEDDFYQSIKSRSSQRPIRN